MCCSVLLCNKVIDKRAPIIWDGYFILYIFNDSLVNDHKKDVYLRVHIVFPDHLPQSARNELVQQRARYEHDETVFMKTCRDKRVKQFKHSWNYQVH